MKYDFLSIERKWQQRWAANHPFQTPGPGEPGFDPNRPKYYVLDMFPYPSGVGLHVGHPLGYIATDIVARYKKMQGFNVLHPMGFDAFGLPAEQYAVETGVHPRITTEKNIENMTTQLKRLGLGYDWNRQLATTDVPFVRWTQWIFLQLYHSYFDPVEAKARPISELLHKLEQEDYFIGLDGELIYSGAEEDLQAITGLANPNYHKWYELDPDQQQRLIDEYRLAFLAEIDVNWCPGLGTVLANEEVNNEGRSERGNFPVFKRPLKQWMLRITAYCDRLIQDLDRVDWPEPIKLLQRNWIGRSHGAEVDFAVEGIYQSGDAPVITVYTTRPDTLFGATYLVLAPEHPLVDEITTSERRTAVQAYREQALSRSAIDRQAETKEKTGSFTGAHAINPVNGERLPIWVADYVMMGYGTGAIMAVPAHDTRDHAFAARFELPIVQVVEGPAGTDIQAAAYTGDGALINAANSDISLNGLPVAEAKAAITTWLEKKGLGRGKVQYKLRDWLFSRQRYWGEPFPILHELDENGQRTGVLRAVDAEDLPVELPAMEDFKPEPNSDPDAPPRPPLGRTPESWRLVTLEGKRYERELNTMPQWAGSCWYYLRYLDPTNSQRFVGEEAERYWMQAPATDAPHCGGVDLYVGGVEHAVLHLLYARFWHKVLFDLGHVSTPEPFGKLFNQGYIQAYYYETAQGVRVAAAEVINADGRPAADVQGQKGQQFFFEGQPVTERYGKMGKSLKNAVGPEEICDRYGADTLRLYEMYLGPLDQSKPWSTADIVGVHRFLARLWRNLIDEETGALKLSDENPSEELDQLTHKTIRRVTEAMETMSFNIAIAALIELNNALVPLPTVPRPVAEVLVRMLAPLAPHVAEELWEKLGHFVPNTSVSEAQWPSFDPEKLVQDTIEYPVQISGKLRGRIVVPADAESADLEAAAKADPRIAEHLAGKTIRKFIVVPGRLINIVAS